MRCREEAQRGAGALVIVPDAPAGRLREGAEREPARARVEHRQLHEGASPGASSLGPPSEVRIVFQRSPAGAPPRDDLGPERRQIQPSASILRVPMGRVVRRPPLGPRIGPSIERDRLEPRVQRSHVPEDPHRDHRDDARSDGAVQDAKRRGDHWGSSRPRRPTGEGPFAPDQRPMLVARSCVLHSACRPAGSSAAPPPGVPPPAGRVLPPALDGGSCRRRRLGGSVGAAAGPARLHMLQPRRCMHHGPLREQGPSGSASFGTRAREPRLRARRAGTAIARHFIMANRSKRARAREAPTDGSGCGRRRPPLQVALSTGAAARYCLVSPATMVNWIAGGHLAAQRTRGGQYRIRLKDLRAFMAAHGMRTEDLDEDLGLSATCWEFWRHRSQVEARTPSATSCDECPVYRSHAEMCHEVRPLLPGGPVRAPACAGCAYFTVGCVPARGPRPATTSSVASPSGSGGGGR
jgi:excisionase family DNA binding protein